MTIRASLAISCLLAAALAWSQQVNASLDYNLQKDAENPVPFSTPLNSPAVSRSGALYVCR